MREFSGSLLRPAAVTPRLALLPPAGQVNPGVLPLVQHYFGLRCAQWCQLVCAPVVAPRLCSTCPPLPDCAPDPSLTAVRAVFWQTQPLLGTGTYYCQLSGPGSVVPALNSGGTDPDAFIVGNWKCPRCNAPGSGGACGERLPPTSSGPGAVMVYSTCNAFEPTYPCCPGLPWRGSGGGSTPTADGLGLPIVCVQAPKTGALPPWSDASPC